MTNYFIIKLEDQSRFKFVGRIVSKLIIIIFQCILFSTFTENRINIIKKNLSFFK